MIEFFSNFLWLYDLSVSENFIIQFIIIYNFLLLIKSSNIYYSLLYLFIELLLIGIYICFYQMELFTGFLWVAEFTVVLIFLVLLIYLNNDGFMKIGSSFFINNFFYLYFFISYIFFFYISNTYYHDIYLLYDYISLWDDFYESINNENMNDFSVLFLSYYNINSIQFILFGYLLFFGTLVCIAIFKLINNYKVMSYSNFFSLFNFFSLKIQFNFLRQQRLNSQTSAVASNRIIKKK